MAGSPQQSSCTAPGYRRKQANTRSMPSSQTHKAGGLKLDAGGGQQAQRVEVGDVIVRGRQRAQPPELLHPLQAAQRVLADVQRLQECRGGRHEWGLVDGGAGRRGGGAGEWAPGAAARLRRTLMDA